MTPSIKIHTSSFKGIGKITSGEITDRFGSAVTDFECHRVRDWEVNRFTYAGRTDELLELGTVEDVFFSAALVPLEGTKDDLKAIAASISPAVAASGLSAYWACRGGKKPKSRLTYRIVVQAGDAAWRSYRRSDTNRAVGQAVRARFPKWRRVDEDADVELWSQQVGKNALIGIRLSDATMRHRTYKQANIPGSLRPTIARASVLLSQVSDSDVFLDPMCGAGTILVERALAGRHRRLMGGDIAEGAVSGTVENFAGRHRPWVISRWDAVDLPLDSASVDKVVCNLPWGRRFGSGDSSGFKKLYRGVMREVARVMKPGARGVFLTKQADVFRESLGSARDLKIAHQSEPVAILGQRARLIVLTR